MKKRVGRLEIPLKLNYLRSLMRTEEKRAEDVNAK